jgi:hypothetical protein
MSNREPWLSLLAPLPAEGGEWHQETRTEPALKGWTQVRLVLGNGVTGLRVLTAEEQDGLQRVLTHINTLSASWE